MGLNLPKNYLQKSVNFNDQREFIQNFVDQCKDLNGGAQPLLTHRTHQGQGKDSVNSWSLLKSSNRASLGYVTEVIIDGALAVTTLHNLFTVLDVGVLAIGVSEKGQNAAGFFGEGMKVSINRLCEMGCKVVYQLDVHSGTLNTMKRTFYLCVSQESRPSPRLS